MHRLDGGNAIHFVQALARADVRDISRLTYMAFNGAYTEHGQPQEIQFHAHDLRRIMADLGIAHWGENVVVIMDDGGISFNGWMDETALAFQVVLGISTTCWDGEFPKLRDLRCQPEVACGSVPGATLYRRSYDPSRVDHWAVYDHSIPLLGDGTDCWERFPTEREAVRYIERERYG